MIIDKTDRGFTIIKFRDRYNSDCTIQESSLATEACIWLGLANAEPQIMAKDTLEGGVGWVPYFIPEEVLLKTRMHLTQELCKELIPILQHFVDTGEIA